ncbi:hypothetical protein V6N11_078165 [Hibiscus sabdariffa]|uniref:dihydroorotase n=1 Tax=Hibiscus sabdariffa TaxID=183260 RepID=A0ABR2TFA9_9ROSI
MVESNFNKETVECIGTTHTHSGNQGSGLRREPSFSRWADEDGTIHLEGRSENIASSIEGSDFELPMLNQSELENGFVEGIRYSKFTEQRMQFNGGSSMEDQHGKDRNGEYTPFDVENKYVGDISADIGVDGASSTVGPKSSSNSVSTADVLKTLFFILVWYTFSTFLTLYNKTLLGDELGKFPAPLLMNSIHFTLQALLSKAITWYWSHRFQPSVPMSYRDYFYRVVPTALSTALDVNLSNASLVFISVTFATMCKSAAPIFLLLFAFAFRLESPSFKLFGIMMVISVGVLLTVARETEFDFWGFVFVMCAAVMSGFRWCMTQILLQKEDYGLKNPLTFMSYVTPVMAVATAVLSLFLDPWHEFRSNNYFNSSWHLARTCFLMLFGGTLAFFMVLTEYILVSVTSAVTVTIAGVVKEAVTILVAVFYFHDDFTWLKGAGLLTIMIGVGLFNWYKYLKLQKESPPTNPAAKSSCSLLIHHSYFPICDCYSSIICCKDLLWSNRNSVLTGDAEQSVAASFQVVDDRTSSLISNNVGVSCINRSRNNFLMLYGNVFCIHTPLSFVSNSILRERGSKLLCSAPTKMINTLVLPRPSEALKLSSTKFDLSRKSKYSKPRMELTLTQPDDWHLHLRDGDLLQAVAPHSAKHFGRAIVMPNLKPPITTTAAAVAYRESILKALPADSNFTPLMTLYLTDKTSPNEIKLARKSGVVFAVKLYPAGATTNSQDGVTDLFGKCLPVLEEMVEENMPLLVHGEVTDPNVDVFDREKVFIDTVLQPLIERLPRLKVVMEHITTMDAVRFVESGKEGFLAATVTPQHLILNRNALFQGGLQPHNYCLPVLKRETHRQAIVSAVTSGSKRFFLGTDSAPHERLRKECPCGCAGIYNAPVALSLYAKVFEEAGALDKLEAFTSFNGPDFYGLPRNTSKIKLMKNPWKVPESLSFPFGDIIPMFAGVQNGSRYAVDDADVDTNLVVDFSGYP